MSISQFPSLPPEVQGQISGLLRVQLGNLLWIQDFIDSDFLVFRLRFWGEKEGILLKAANSPKEGLNSVAAYTIKAPQSTFTTYLKDMNSIKFEVLDQDWRPIGYIKILVRSHLVSGKTTYRGHYGSPQLVVDKVCAIISSFDQEVAIGQLEMKISTQFQEWFVNRSSIEILESFQANQEWADKQTKTIGVKRICKDCIQKQNLVIEGKKYGQTVIVPKNSLRKIEKPYVIQEVPVQFQQTKKQENEVVRQENLQNRKRQTERKDNVQESQVEESKMKKKQKLYADVFKRQKKKQHWEKRISQKKVQYQGQERRQTEEQAKRKRQSSKSPSTTNRQKQQVRGRIKGMNQGSRGKLNQESKRLQRLTQPQETAHQRSHKRLEEQRKREEMQYYKGIPKSPERNKRKIKKLTEPGSQQIKNPEQNLKPYKKQQEKIQKHEKPSFNTIKPTSQPPNPFLTEKSPKQQTIQEKIPFQPQKLEKKTQKISQIDPVIYLYLDNCCQFQGLPNLYLSYKFSPESQRITTPVQWEYREKSGINHKMMQPLSLSQLNLKKLESSQIFIQVWDKASPISDQLLGLVKLPLAIFSNIIRENILVKSQQAFVAVDQYRAINSIKTGRNVGFLKVCLALGTTAQIQKLSQSHSVPRPQLFQRIPQYQNRSTEIQKEDQQYITRPFQSIPQEPLKIWKSDQQREKINQVSKPIIPIEEKPKIILKDVQTTLNLLKEEFQIQRLDLIELLQTKDTNKTGFFHPDQLKNLLLNLKSELLEQEIQNLITQIIHSSSSTKHRIKIKDILDFFNLKSPPTNKKHTYLVSLNWLSSCKILQKLPRLTLYLKYLFPNQSNYIQSDLLESNHKVLLNIQAKHSFTLSLQSKVQQAFTPLTNGLQIALCKSISRCQEQIIARGLIPIQELTCLLDGQKINRVVCLYGDRKLAVQGYGNDLIGKVQIQIQHLVQDTYEQDGGEVLYKTTTDIQKVLPRNNQITLFIEKITDMSKAQKYYRDLGILLQSLQFYFKFTPFFQNQDISLIYPSIYTQKFTFNKTVSLNFKFNFQVLLEDSLINYFKNGCSLLELIGVIENDELHLAQTVLSLQSLLLNSKISGGFPLLNDFGNFMGCAHLVLACQLQDQILVLDSPPVEIQEPKIPVYNQSKQVHLSIQSAYIDQDSDQNNYYVQFEWFDKQVYKSPPYLRSLKPFWNSSYTLSLPSVVLIDTENLILEVWNKSFSRKDSKVGICKVELKTLLVVDYIDGWYHIESEEGKVGQIKLRIQPLSSLKKSKQQSRSPKHKENTGILQKKPLLKQERKYRDYQQRNLFREKQRQSSLWNEYNQLFQKNDYYLDNLYQQELMLRHLQNMNQLQYLNSSLQEKSPVRHTSPLKLVSRSPSLEIKSQRSPVRESFTRDFQYSFSRNEREIKEQPTVQDATKRLPVFEAQNPLQKIAQNPISDTFRQGLNISKISKVFKTKITNY